MSSLQRRKVLAIVSTAIGGLMSLSGCLRDRNQSPTQSPTANASSTPTRYPSSTVTPTSSPTATPTATPTETSTSTLTETATATPKETPTATPTETPTEKPSSKMIPFEPLTTFTSDEYGYQVARPESWVIEDGEGGNAIELSDPNDLAFLRVVVTRTIQSSSPPSLDNRLPGAVGITSHDRTKTTLAGQRALRFERSYLMTGNGPMVRVKGLIVSLKDRIFIVQCGVIVQPFDDPHATRTPKSDGASPLAVEWTATIEQATARIIDSFSLPS